MTTSLINPRLDFEINVLGGHNVQEYTNANPNITVLEYSLEQIVRMELLSNLKIDILVHLAWENVSKVMSDSHIDQLNIQKEFLTNAINSGIKNVIISGYCFEYGKINGPLDVRSTIPQPCTKYGIAKNELRIFFENYLNNRPNIALHWMRIFYAYGPGQHERSLYTQLINAIRDKKSVFNMSRGFQIRDFVSVDEVSDAIIANILNVKTGFHISNICSGNPVSVREFVENVLRKNNSKMTLNLGLYPIPEYEPIAFGGIR
jgi:Nucleoside-diphosphate-sugar epimerases